jgi:hypothetical protein
MITYRNYTPVAHWNEKYVPVPGWGMRAHFLAGSPRIAVGDAAAPLLNPAIATWTPQQPGWWASRSTGTKIVIGVGAIAIVGIGAYMVMS